MIGCEVVPAKRNSLEVYSWSIRTKLHKMIDHLKAVDKLVMPYKK